jgi:hypothetical protein
MSTSKQQKLIREQEGTIAAQQAEILRLKAKVVSKRRQSRAHKVR